MLKGNGDFDVVKQCTPRIISLKQKRWFGSRVMDFFRNRETECFEKRDFFDTLRSTYLGKLLVKVKSYFGYVPTYLPQHEVSLQNCGLKYALIHSDYTKDGKFRSYAYGPKQIEFFPTDYHINNAGVLHAAFKGE